MDKQQTTIIAEAAIVAAEKVATAATAASTEAKRAVLIAAESAKLSEQNYVDILSDVLRKVFGEHEESKRFIDTKRIPLICKDIANMNEKIDKIDSNITWIVRLIIGAVILAMLGLIFVNK